MTIFIILHETGHCINHSIQKDCIKSKKTMSVYLIPSYYFEMGKIPFPHAPLIDWVKTVEISVFNDT